MMKMEITTMMMMMKDLVMIINIKVIRRREQRKEVKRVEMIKLPVSNKNANNNEID